VIFAEAAGHLAVQASTLRVDASHNLAGYVLMEAGKDLPEGPSRGELLVHSSELSSSHGAGGGAILLQSDGGLSVVNSSLKAITDRFPVVAGYPSVEGSSPVFYGGQITLFNQSVTKPLLVSSSSLVAHHHTAGGPLSSPFLGITPEDDEFGTFGTASGWTKGIHSVLSGGFLQLYSKAGLRVEAGSRLDVSSVDPFSGKPDTISGTIAILNSGSGAIEIEESRLDGHNGSAQRTNAFGTKAGAVYIYGEGDIRARDVKVDLGTAIPKANDNNLAVPFLDISSGGKLAIAGHNILVSEAGIHEGISLRDSLVPPESKDRIRNEILARVFTDDLTYPENISFDLPYSSVDNFFIDFNNYIDRYRVIFEKAYAGSATAQSAWPLPLSSPPSSSLIPQDVSRQPSALVKSVALAAENQPDAAQQLVEAQQQALADAVASFGLSQGAGRVRSVAELQQRLLRVQQLSPGNRVSAKAVQGPTLALPAYRPAIVQLALSELTGDQVQIKGILLLAEGQPLSFHQTLPAERVKRAIRGFQTQLSRQESIDPVTGPGAELSNWLLRPLADALRNSGANALLLAVDRGLQGIPYGALPFGDQPLAERFALSVSPSLGLLDLDAERGSVDGLLLAAGASRFQQSLDPLPMVPRELAALANEQSATLLMDEQFTVDAFRRLALQDRFRQLHIATHAEFKPGQDDAAKLYTPRDSIGLTTLRNVLRSRPQDRSMDLISLSACHTALGDEQSELGFVGMALLAGTRSAIGTLWEVDDSASAAFFVQYYRYLRGGLGKDQALQATARAFRNGTVRLEGERLIGPSVSQGGDAMLLRVDSPEERRRLSDGLRHPHFWAGMVLTGSPW
jgi:CHAT domain-containing protein